MLYAFSLITISEVKFSWLESPCVFWIGFHRLLQVEQKCNKAFKLSYLPFSLRSPQGTKEIQYKTVPEWLRKTSISLNLLRTVFLAGHIGRGSCIKVEVTLPSESYFNHSQLSRNSRYAVLKNIPVEWRMCIPYTIILLESTVSHLGLLLRLTQNLQCENIIPVSTCHVNKKQVSQYYISEIVQRIMFRYYIFFHCKYYIVCTYFLCGILNTSHVANKCLQHQIESWGCLFKTGWSEK